METVGGVEECIAREHARFVGVVTLVTGSSSLAEEAVQEAFVRAWEREQRGHSFDHLSAWVVTVALNLARDGRRRGRSERAALDRLVAPPSWERPDLVEVRLAVRDAVDGLAARQRDAVVLYYFLDLDISTVARVLRVSEGTVKTALSRARQRLASLLDDQLET